VKIMKGLILRVGIDKGFKGGDFGPVFDDGRFEYIPIPEPENHKPTTETRTYNDLKGAKGEPLSDYVPAIADRTVHFDPAFDDTCTYGDPTTKRISLLKLKEGDLLVFYAGLRPYNTNKYPEGLYFIGYFTVKKVINFCKLLDEEVEECYRLYSNNAHMKRQYRTKKEMRKNTGERCGLVIVVGDKVKSKRLEKAILISEPKQDRRGRTYYVVSKKMSDLLDIHGAIQKSVPPRWIKEASVSKLKNILGI
jgi:hypothetical protein